MSNPILKKTSGFTLVELMIALTLVSILVIVAIPSFSGSMKRNRAASQANDLVTALAQARSEAIRRNLVITVCSSANSTTCAASTNWATGWIVFIDVNQNGAYDDDGDTDLCETGSNNLPSEDCVLKVYPELSGNSTLTASANFLQFRGSGETLASANDSFPPQPGNCKTTDKEKRVINITPIGRADMTRSNCT